MRSRGAAAQMLVQGRCWSIVQSGPPLSTFHGAYRENHCGNWETRGVVRRRHGDELPYKERVGGSSPSTPTIVAGSRSFVCKLRYIEPTLRHILGILT